MSTYESRLQQRKAHFIERARQRLTAMRSNLELLAQHPERLELLAPVMKEFHQLAAAAGIYEMADLCRLAVDAEDMLLAAQKAKSALGEQEISSALQAIDGMGQALAAKLPQKADRC